MWPWVKYRKKIRIKRQEFESSMRATTSVHSFIFLREKISFSNIWPFDPRSAHLKYPNLEHIERLLNLKHISLSFSFLPFLHTHSLSLSVSSLSYSLSLSFLPFLLFLSPSFSTLSLSFSFIPLFFSHVSLCIRLFYVFLNFL
jgi:hypothetical protein